MEKIPNEQYRARLKRVEDTIQLRVPDKVPIVPYPDYFTAKYTGTDVETAFYEPVKWRQANKKTIIDFEPDMYHFLRGWPGRAWEALGCKQVKWPGQPGIYGTHRFIEGEYMEADDYNLFLTDYNDYMLRTFLPRTCEHLDAFKYLFPLKSVIMGFYQIAMTGLFANPGLINAFEALAKAGREVQVWEAAWGGFNEEMRELGFAEFSDSVVFPPFDLLSDFHRGMRGVMLDMYRNPDELIQACESLVPLAIEGALSQARRNNDRIIFIPLHRGADGFMSLKQFETFYWPTLKKLVLAIVSAGFTPCIFYEGSYTSRLEYLLELPRGKVIAWFDATDIFRAKEVLANHTCIKGNVPVSLLHAGTTSEVQDYCKKLIDVVGKDGGFIMCSGGPIEEAKVENVKAMFNFTKEYGIYK